MSVFLSGVNRWLSNSIIVLMHVLAVCTVISSYPQIEYTLKHYASTCINPHIEPLFLQLDLFLDMNLFMTIEKAMHHAEYLFIYIKLCYSDIASRHVHYI